MAYKVTISDGTILEKSIETVTFNANPPPDNYYCMRTYTINSMEITGGIGAGEKTISLYEWSLLPANNPDCYKEIVVEQTHADQTVRIVKFSKAFVVGYSESYSKGEGFGHFSILIRQLAGVDIEITNEITPQSTMTEISSEVEELNSPLVQSAGIIATPSIIKKNRPNFTDILAKKKMIQDNDNVGISEVSDNIPPAFRQTKFASSYEARVAQTPAEDNIIVGFEGARGESLCTLKPPPDPNIKKILDQVGINGIQYRNGVPDFSPVAKAQLEINYMLGGRGDFGGKARTCNFAQADKKFADQLNNSPELARQFGMEPGGITARDIDKYRDKNKLTWHELNDVKTIQLVPSKINSTFGHLGGIGEINTGAFEPKGFACK